LGCQVSKLAATVCLKSNFINNLKIKKMKQVILAVAIFIGISVSANAQTSSNKETKEEQKMELKDHKCTEACHTSGHCVLAHGEKGHTCTVDCKKMETNSSQAEMKEHVCTEACKNGQHMYVHGETGHTCGETCKKKM
jgi:septal ring-binding cell division protein DamX